MTKRVCTFHLFVFTNVWCTQHGAKDNIGAGRGLTALNLTPVASCVQQLWTVLVCHRIVMPGSGSAACWSAVALAAASIMTA